MSKRTDEKTCFCHRCKKAFHYLGINSHTASHRRKGESYRVTYSDGTTKVCRFDEQPVTQGGEGCTG